MPASRDGGYWGSRLSVFSLRGFATENAVVEVNLDKAVACDIGSHFAIREGGRTVGSGVITEVVD